MTEPRLYSRSVGTGSKTTRNAGTAAFRLCDLRQISRMVMRDHRDSSYKGQVGYKEEDKLLLLCQLQFFYICITILRDSLQVNAIMAQLKYVEKRKYVLKIKASKRTKK